MNNEEFYKLLDKYAESLCSEKEQAIVENWYAGFHEDESRQILSEHVLLEVQERLRERLIPPVQQRSIVSRYRYYAAASIIFFALAVGAGFFIDQKNTAKHSLSQVKIHPGSNRAVLILANGKHIDLTDVPAGKIAGDVNTVIDKKSGGEVQFSGSAQTSTEIADQSMNTITIPRGGQWKLLLKDGTAVWLNAASTLRFPTAFLGATREIYLEGEAYFEVAKDKVHPFIVHTGKQTVQVLGTHFDINAYPEEGEIQTTLLEGSVRVNGSVLLRPGQKSVYDGNLVRICDADTEGAVAWKEGNFVFNSAELGAIMRQVSRWYDVEVQFENPNLRATTFSGIVSRSVSISTLLRRLSLTKEVSFKTDGRKILVLPNQAKN